MTSLLCTLQALTWLKSSGSRETESSR